ncbi:MAG TPA: serine hydrolase [Candidatus Dormibacteraeota bacterium]|nr:serine hydrolase [Candidatus Dormibacteraeota bacterium]
MKTLKRRGGKLWLCLAAVIVLAGGYVYWALGRPLPDLKPVLGPNHLSIQTPAPKLAWPGTGQAAVGVMGSQALEIHGSQTPLPTASTAKLITALAVLRQKPLVAGEQGPNITLSAADVALYNSYVSQSGSVVQVTAGEQISEYQMLQAMMLPSANNMADSLAVWAFGSLSAYSNFASSYVAGLGLANTHIGTDASGFSPTTTSTASDLVKLGEIVMRDPVLSQIVGQSTASGLPIVNNVKNVNSLLGTSNIIGIKTGNTDQAGGVFVGAARANVNNQSLVVITAVIGQPSLWQAMHDSLPLIQGAQANFSSVTVVPAGSILGRYQQPWGGTITAVAAQPLITKAWNGDSLAAVIKLNPTSAKTQAGQTVGSLTIPQTVFTGQQSVPIKLSAAPDKPSLYWRLLHAL